MPKIYFKVIWLHRGQQRVRGGLSETGKEVLMEHLAMMPMVRDIRCHSYTENYGVDLTPAEQQVY